MVSSLHSQEAKTDQKEYRVQDYLTDEKLNVEVKEFFIKQLRETGLVKPVDNHEFIHFFVDNYNPKYKPLIKAHFEQFSILSKNQILSETVNVISLIAKDFNNYKLKNPNAPKKYNENVNMRHYEIFDLGNKSTEKGPGQPCNNADFETGDATGWDLTDGEVDSNPYGYINVTPVGLNAQHVMVTGGNDPVVGAALPMVFPGGGGVSMQLGDGTGTNYGAAAASQTFMVDANSQAFTYSYALVLEDPSGHSLGEKPFFKVNMYDQNGDPITCGDYQVIAGDVASGGDPDFVAYSGGFYLPWRTTFASLQGYTGQNVTIEFITGDCGQGGHYGYGYIDASCIPLEIIPDQTVVCGGQPVTLTAPPGGAGYTWSPNGETTQSITTNVPGHYEVEIVPVTGAACSVTLSADIGGSPDYPIAEFAANPTNVCAGTPITFTNNSYVVGTSAIDSVQWDFNSDGIIDDTNFNTTYTYPSAGNYTATLIVWNNGCQDDTTLNVTITPGTTANFTAPNVCLGTATTFTDASLPGGTVVNWNWDFDNDGNVDNTSQNPNFSFLSDGTHSVTLSVSGAGGSCPSDTTIDIVVYPKPTANFGGTNQCLTTATQFTDSSTVSSGTITGWEWDFDNNGSVDNTTQNPSNTYAGSGTQTVTLIVTTDNTCKDTITSTVEVFDNPIAAFTSDTACENGVSSMTDASTLGSIGIANWDWDFNGDLTPDATTQNPTNNFGAAGSYPVTLTVTDSNLCTNSITQNVIVAPNPTAAFNFSDECFGSATGFTDQSLGNGGTINGWEWDFTSNGTIDNTSQNPSNGYSSAGNYTTTLIVTTTQGCKDTTTNTVDVDAIPVANFGATKECLGTATQFTDSSTVVNSNVIQWSWDFDDGSGTSVQQNPNYTYALPGTYNVSLTATSDSGCINTIIIPVTVSDNPVANFVSDTACNNFASNFTDITIGTVGIAGWDWDFGNDGSIEDNSQNPSYVFAAAGTYPVNLAVVDSFGCVHDTTLNVTVSENPIAAFTFTDECYGTATSFTDQSNNNGGTTPIDTWEWDFESDNTIDDTNQNPTNTYSSEGSYTTTLVVTSVLGCKDTSQVLVDVDAIPVSNFGGTNECLGNTTTFTDSSTTTIGNVNQWTWDFGDGSPVDNTQNPTHQYASSGVKNVTLTVVTDSGCTHTFNTNVEVYNNPIANFTPDTVCNSAASNFTDQTTLGDFGIATWSWDFNADNNEDSNVQNPSYTFNGAGTYNVNLMVTDSFGCTHDTIKTVTVSENPIAAFTFSDECQGTATNFTDQSNNNGGTTPIDSWEWDFGDSSPVDMNQNPSHLYGTEGNYTATLVVTSVLGCKDTAQVNVDVDAVPVANFGVQDVCLNTEGFFTDSSTTTIGNVNQWTWDFGDGLVANTNQNPTYTYNNSGVFNVTLTVVTDSGCTDTKTIPLEIYPNPIADFDTTDVCLNVAAQFTDQSNGNGGTISQWAWDFENNGSVDDVTQNPNHLYPADGNYNIELIVTTNSGCSDTIVKSVTIYPMPTADYTFVNSCYMDSVVFTDNSNVTSGTIDQWNWDFGNGQTSTDQNPSEVYGAEGVYNVELIVTTNNNCKDTVTKNNIEVWPLPDVDFSPTRVCINYDTDFQDLSTISNANTTNTNVQWDWNFGDAMGTSNVQNPTYAYASSGVFNATLIVTSNHNCVDSITKPVTVNPQPVVNFDANKYDGCIDPDTKKLCVNFYDSTYLESGSILSWQWSMDGQVFNSQNPSYCFKNPSHSSVRDYDVSLIVTSDQGCMDSISKPSFIHVYPKPLASFSFTPEQEETTIVNKELTFTDESVIASVWNWDMGDGSTSTAPHPVHEFPDTGYYWVSLTIENSYGCPDSTAKLIRINPIYAIWIPNAFSPDGNGTNDFFYVDGYGIKELHMMIFDRWGVKLYDGVGVDQTWDGYYKGEIVQTDVYVYKVRAKDIFDEWHDYVGKVTVIK